MHFYQPKDMRQPPSVIPEIGDGFFSQRCKQNQKIPVLINGHTVVPQLLCAGLCLSRKPIRVRFVLHLLKCLSLMPFN